MAVQFPALQPMAMAFALILAETSALHWSRLNYVEFSKVATVAPQVITPGSSLAGTTLQGLAAPGVTFTCVIEVENWTRFALMSPQVDFERLSGKNGLTTPVPEIMPGKREAFAVQKSSPDPTGVQGIVSWRVPEIGGKKYLVIAWSVFSSDLNYKKNWVAAGFSKPKVTRKYLNSEWFELTKQDKNSELMLYMAYSDSTVRTVSKSDNRKFVVAGTMTNLNRSVIKMVFRPFYGHWQELALPILTLLNNTYK